MGPRDNTVRSESDKDKYHSVSVMWNLKNNTNESICQKTETDSQTQKAKLLITKREREGSGTINQKLGLPEIKVKYIKIDEQWDYCTAPGHIFNI